MMAEEEMITVEEREKIRRAYFVEERSIRQIAREQHHSRDTIKKAIEAAEPESYTLQKPRAAPALGPYKDRIDELLEQNADLPRKQRFTGHKIYEDIVAKGYTGSESGVRTYIAGRRREKKKRDVYIPLEFDPGTDAQVDWGEALVIMDGKKITVQIFLLRLCYSRRLFARAYPSQKQESFLEGHVQGFQFMKGVPRRIAYDNLTTAVQRVLTGRNRKEQDRFVLFRSHYLFESRFCTPGQGHEKGRVEDGVGFARRNFLVPIPEVASYEELNDRLLAACLADDQRHVDRQELTIGEAWEVERGNLLPLPERDFECCVNRPVALNGYCQVEYETNRYSVPAESAYQNLVLKAYPFHIDILHLNDVIASHARSYDHKQDVFDPLHYLPLLEQRPGAFEHAKPIRRWREKWTPVYEQLLAQLQSSWPDGRGIREFIQILKLHRDHPADLIEQAVVEALKHGCIHLDGVQLCLRQLTNPDPPIPPIDLTPWPELGSVGRQAPDLSRYDLLLEKV